MRRSTVLILPLLLVFPASGFWRQLQQFCAFLPNSVIHRKLQEKAGHKMLVKLIQSGNGKVLYPGLKGKMLVPSLTF